MLLLKKLGSVWEMKAKFEQGLVVTPICWSSLILSILDGFWWFLVSLGTSRLVSFDFEIMLHFPHLNQLLFLKDALRYLHNSSARPWIRIKQHANILPQVELKFMSYPILIIKLFKKFIFKFAKCLLLNFKTMKIFSFWIFLRNFENDFRASIFSIKKRDTRKSSEVIQNN